MKRRDEVCLNKLSELNSYIKYDILERFNIFYLIKNYEALIKTLFVKWKCWKN